MFVPSQLQRCVVVPVQMPPFLHSGVHLGHVSANAVWFVASTHLRQTLYGLAKSFLKQAPLIRHLSHAAVQTSSMPQ